MRQTEWTHEYFFRKEALPKLKSKIRKMFNKIIFTYADIKSSNIFNIMYFIKHFTINVQILLINKIQSEPSPQKKHEIKNFSKLYFSKFKITFFNIHEVLCNPMDRVIGWVRNFEDYNKKELLLSLFVEFYA